MPEKAGPSCPERARPPLSPGKGDARASERAGWRARRRYEAVRGILIARRSGGSLTSGGRLPRGILITLHSCFFPAASICQFLSLQIPSSRPGETNVSLYTRQKKVYTRSCPRRRGRRFPTGIVPIEFSPFPIMTIFPSSRRRPPSTGGSGARVGVFSLHRRVEWPRARTWMWSNMCAATHANTRGRTGAGWWRMEKGLPVLSFRIRSKIPYPLRPEADEKWTCWRVLRPMK